MDIRELKLFLKLSETLHYGRTSQIMAISPSALSRTIQRLEDEVGEKLFERDNRSVSLTIPGIHFRQYARDVIDRWEALSNTLKGESNVIRGEITLYSSVTGCYEVLPPILERLREKYPEVHVHLISGSANDSVLTASEGLADIIVAAEPETLPPNLEFYPVLSTKMVLISSAKTYNLNFEMDYSTVPMILPDKSIFRKRIDDWFLEMGIKPDIYSEVSGNEAIIAMSRLGFGVGIVPMVVVNHSPYLSDLRVLDSKITPVEVGILIQKRKLSNPCVRAFLSVVKNREENWEVEK
jgi:LysR family transcriptional regulator, positive regulator for ilvC